MIGQQDDPIRTHLISLGSNKEVIGIYIDSLSQKEKQAAIIELGDIYPEIYTAFAAPCKSQTQFAK